MRKYVILQN